MGEKIEKIGIFLVHSLNNCGIGGMETHQQAFIHRYVQNPIHRKAYFPYIIENEGLHFIFHDFSKETKYRKLELFDLHDLLFFLKEQVTFSIIFLNDGWWIESVASFKTAFPLSHIYMRSGGNDIELAPWNNGTFSYKQRRLLWKYSINKLDFIIANSDYSVSRLISLGVNMHKIVKIRGGVNKVLCSECMAKKDSLRKELVNHLGIVQQFIVIFATRFVPFKGIFLALNCIKKSRNADNCHLLFVGSGQLELELKEWCSKNFSLNQFTFWGETSNEDTIRLIASSDVLVNTSIYLNRQSGDGNYHHTETMGRSMMEAISVGTKIIATNVGGTNELFSENQYIGYLSDLDEQSIISAFNMVESIINEQTYQIPDYSWERVFELYDNMFSKILK